MYQRERVFRGSSVVIGGRAALALSHVLVGHLREGRSLGEVLMLLRADEATRADALGALAALVEAGREWRAFPRAGNAETGGNDHGLASVVTMSVDETAPLLRLTPRRVRQLAAAGDIAAEKTPRGWRLSRDAVLAFQERTP